MNLFLEEPDLNDDDWNEWADLLEDRYGIADPEGA